ncbi:hypothetical protein MIR68_010062 [Amoeboaphelidium protococcarum]|nr:hypothetical protein MIR68_010062 [Amoeboaphelidium protococcarum]
MVILRKRLVFVISALMILIVVYSIQLLPDVGPNFKSFHRPGSNQNIAVNRRNDTAASGPLHYSKLPEVTAAVVYLIAHHEENNFRKSVKMTLDNFISLSDHKKYPVIALYEDNYPKSDLDALIKDTTSMYNAKGCTLVYQKIKFTFPKHYDQKTQIAINFAYPNYNFMIHLWFMDIFQMERIKDLEYYWRLDTDSFIHNKVYVDPFRFMKHQGIKYGYRDDTVRDVDRVTVGMLEAVDRWLEGHVLARSLSRQNDMELPAVDEREGYGPLMIYTNFEIAHVPTFQNRAKNEKVQLQDGSIMQTADRNKQLVEFADYIDRTNRIFTHRWGDAPLRYYQLKMLFSWEKEVWKFCAVDYEHAHHNKRFEPCVDDIALNSIVWRDD